MLDYVHTFLPYMHTLHLHICMRQRSPPTMHAPSRSSAAGAPSGKKVLVPRSQHLKLGRQWVRSVSSHFSQWPKDIVSVCLSLCRTDEANRNRSKQPDCGRPKPRKTQYGFSSITIVRHQFKCPVSMMHWITDRLLHHQSCFADVPSPRK